MWAKTNGSMNWGFGEAIRARLAVEEIKVDRLERTPGAAVTGKPSGADDSDTLPFKGREGFSRGSCVGDEHMDIADRTNKRRAYVAQLA
jgi:hypothetical protein